MARGKNRRIRNKYATLAQRIKGAALSAIGEHLWDSLNPEFRQIVGAAGFVHRAPGVEAEARAFSKALTESDEPAKKRRPRRAWREESSDDEKVIELVKQPDGSYGEKR